MNVELPDGTIIQDVPEGTTRAQIEQKYRAHIAATPQPSMYEATAQEDSNGQNLLAAIGGAMKAPYVGIRQALGVGSPQEVKDWKDSMAGLWSTPMGKVGTVAGGAAAAAPLAVASGASVPGLAASGLAYGAAQPVTDGQSRLGNAIEGMGGNIAGKYLGDALGSGISSLLGRSKTNLAAQQAANTVRDATLKTAQDAGYVLPPSQVNPSTLNRVAEGFAGKLTTAQNAAFKNQNVTNNLVRQNLGIPTDAPLTVDTLQAVRNEAGKAYEALKGMPTMAADSEYANALDKIATQYDLGHGGMKSLRNSQVEGLLQDAATPAINPANAVEFLKNLREQGFANTGPMAKAADKTLGRAQLGIANAVEDLMDRSLSDQGSPELLDAFRAARMQIAKTYTAQKAINPGTGNIVASKLAGMLKKGAPLSGEMKTAAQVASAFPAATKEITTSLPQLSPLDYMGGILTGSATGNPLAALSTFARPAVRAGILSKAYQKSMVQPQTYEMGLLGKAASGLDTEATRKLLQSLGMSITSIQQ